MGMKKYFTKKERVLYTIRQICWLIAYLPTKIGNKVTDSLNKSYYKQSK